VAGKSFPFHNVAVVGVYDGQAALWENPEYFHLVVVTGKIHYRKRMNQWFVSIK